MRRCSYRLMLGLAAVCALALPCYAGPTVYSGADPGANSTDPRPNSVAAAGLFDAAAGGLGAISLLDFESSPLGAFSSLTPAPGVTITGADVGGSNQTVLNAPFGAPDNLYGYNTTLGGSKFVSLYGGTLTFTFADPIQAFGAYFSGLQGSVVGTETLTFSDGNTQTVNIPDMSGGIAFVGFTDAGMSVSSILLNVNYDIVGVDDVRFVKTGQQAGGNVPEPGSLAFLVGVGIAGTILGRRRMRRA